MFISHQTMGFLGIGAGPSVFGPQPQTLSIDIWHNIEPPYCVGTDGRENSMVLSVTQKTQEGMPHISFFIQESSEFHYFKIYHLV